MNYTPKPGSTTERVFNHLRACGRSLTQAEISAALQIPAGRLSGMLEAAIEHGMVSRTKADGERAARFTFVGVAEFEPAPAPTEATGDREDDDYPRRVLVAAAKAQPLAKRGPASVFDLGASMAEAAERTSDANPPAAKGPAATTAKPGERVTLDWREATRSARPAPTVGRSGEMQARVAHALPAGEPLSCALFNTGDLLIEAPDQPALRLTRLQARELVTYLERLRDALEEAA